jgi:pimeloyl-ACP methyl ester carboxylesterase
VSKDDGGDGRPPAMVALEPLVDPRVPVGREFSSESKTVVLACAAMSHFRPPPFHLFEATTGLFAKRLFVRDPERIWFQHGLPGFGDTIDEVGVALRAILDEQEVERLVVMGSSAGGYAALAFGALLGADLVLSFSPQTTLDRTWLDSVGDDRWPGHFKTLEKRGGADPRWSDLRVALPREHRDGTVFEVHYPALFDADRLHAERLADLPGVRMHAHERASHNFIQGLRNRGELPEIFRAAGLADRP